jgi:hypothetical protein
VRRLDLAADFTKFPISEADRERLKPTRCAINTWHDPSGVFTGFTIGSGEQSARIYDKTRELSLPSRADKQEVEHARWAMKGWLPDQRVTRVEFQHSGRNLREYEIHDGDVLCSKIDALWQYDVREWLRLVEPTSNARSTRRATDPRWRPVQEVVFENTAAPAKRVRISGGISAALLLGYVVSVLGARHDQPQCTSTLRRCGQLHDLSSGASDEQHCRDICSALFDAAAAVCVEELAKQASWRALLQRLHAKCDAALAAGSSGFTPSSPQGGTTDGEL